MTDRNWPLPWNNRGELAFRRIYGDLLETKAITRVFRPGARPSGGYKGYFPGDRVILRVVEIVGTDLPPTPRAPVFSAKSYGEAEIVGVSVRKLGELGHSDFTGSSPDVQDQEMLKRHLGLIYNMGPEDLGPSADVTVITFRYLLV